MGYLLTKQATDSNDKGSIDLGKLLGGGLTGGGLAATGAIGNSLFQKKLMNDAAYAGNVIESNMDLVEKLQKSKNSAAQWLFKKLSTPDSKTAAMFGRGMTLAHGFKHLQLPGKLKALGLVAAPIAAGGIVNAAVD